MTNLLYKFRGLNDRSIDFITKRELYFASPEQLNDPFEVGVLLDIPEDTHGIVNHLKGYLQVLERSCASELHLLGGLSEKYFDGDLSVYDRYHRRYARVREYDRRILYAQNLIRETEQQNGATAKHTLETFYAPLIEQLRGAGICCLSGALVSSLLWSHYADEHRGICFEFINIPPLFRRDKKILEHRVFYTPTGRINPIEHGYLATHDLLFSTKSKEWQYEEEVRFFIFGDPRPVQIPASNFISMIFGCRALSGEGLSGPRLEEHRALLRKLAMALREANRLRPKGKKLTIKIAERQPGMSLAIKPIEDPFQFLMRI